MALDDDDAATAGSHGNSETEHRRPTELQQHSCAIDAVTSPGRLDCIEDGATAGSHGSSETDHRRPTELQQHSCAIDAVTSPGRLDCIEDGAANIDPLLFAPDVYHAGDRTRSGSRVAAACNEADADAAEHQPEAHRQGARSPTPDAANYPVAAGVPAPVRLPLVQAWARAMARVFNAGLDRGRAAMGVVRGVARRGGR
jgi:hypothetical protein